MTDYVELPDAPLISATRLLAERNFYGIVWLDTDLVVQGLYGPLVSFVEFGAPVGASILPFIGLETEIISLRRTHAVFDIPSVTIITQEGRTPRLNLAAFWSEAESCYLVLVSRAIVSSDLEIELNRQIRARLIAETDVKLKSRQLEKANADLERANADLEQFASIISHDLKAPLREMRYLAKDAEAALAAGDLSQTRQGLSDMRAQSQRMAQMLSTLLAYASVGQKSDAVELVDTEALVAAVVRHLPCPPGIKVEISGIWPRLMTATAPLDLVLRNLIDNAISHHDRDVGTVTVTAKDLCDGLILTIADDGPGIFLRDQQAIFLPFRTLVTRADGNGGMGLPLVRRTLASVGGRIDVMSDAPRLRGTTFTVYWPKIEAADAKKSFDLNPETTLNSP
jgi:signal transduction histidine kinase